MSDKKAHNAKYTKIVSQAKAILVNIGNGKMDVADLAIKACTIKMGGQISGFYTTANFADDIGVNRKTLSCWIHSRKIQKELKKSKITVANESDLNKIRLVLRKDKTMDAVNKYSDSGAILKAYNLKKKISREEYRLINIEAQLRGIKFSLESFVLKELDTEKVSTINSLLKNCSKTIKDKMK